ncbi:hypothetical protein QQZ08_003071 [Neonectria magnoliae]|uniref:Uncharacterized protein n=1 Tax=Neonectria magnoliae TaxID=2732573 RepID=A0ABR1IBV3_9HYPO
MPSSDIKHDYSMEAGLLSTHGEERTMTKEEAEFEDYYDEEEIDCSNEGTRTTSYARRALIALAVLGLLGIGLVSIGGATGVCPGHLRHAMNGEMSIKEAVHGHKPNLSESMAQLARRQDNANTPGASASTDSVAGTTDAATQPSATAGTTEQPSETQPSATEATETEVAETQPTETQASETQASETQATETQATETSEPPSAISGSSEPSNIETDEAPTTSDAQETTQEAPTSTQEDTPSSTDEVTESATSDEATTAAETTSEEPQSTSEPDSTASDSDEEATSTEESTEATQRTITTGTRTTSSAVPRTYTSTMAQGGITTYTSTSWVAVVPPASATTTGDPNLQNAAPQSSVHRILSAAIGMILGLFLL